MLSTPVQPGESVRDYLVNNAGNSLHVGFEQMTEAQFDEVVNVHFKGVYFLTQKLLPVMNDGGRLVNISSGLTRFFFPGVLHTRPQKEPSRF
jgi:NAD(P)-dependent dehydrogenase (short-subunit alcohol dehydrogenase family)